MKKLDKFYQERLELKAQTILRDMAENHSGLQFWLESVSVEDQTFIFNVFKTFKNKGCKYVGSRKYSINEDCIVG